MNHRQHPRSAIIDRARRDHDRIRREYIASGRYDYIRLRYGLSQREMDNVLNLVGMRISSIEEFGSPEDRARLRASRADRITELRDKAETGRLW